MRLIPSLNTHAENVEWAASSVKKKTWWDWVMRGRLCLWAPISGLRGTALMPAYSVRNALGRKISRSNVSREELTSDANYHE